MRDALRDWDHSYDLNPLAVGAVGREQSHDRSIQGREFSPLVDGKTKQISVGHLPVSHEPSVPDSISSIFFLVTGGESAARSKTRRPNPYDKQDRHAALGPHAPSVSRGSLGPPDRHARERGRNIATRHFPGRGEVSTAAASLRTQQQRVPSSRTSQTTDEKQPYAKELVSCPRSPLNMSAREAGASE